MVLNCSDDPVLVKKVYLNIWTLREQVKAMVADSVAKHGPLNQESLQKLYDDYLELSALTTHFRVDKAAMYLNEDTFSEQQDSDTVSEEDLADILNPEDSGEEIEETEEEEEEDEGEEEEIPAEDVSTEDLISQAADEESLDQDAIESMVNGQAEDQDSENKIIQIPKNHSFAPAIEDAALAKGCTLLNEVFMQQIYFFSTHKYLIGQTVLIQFLVPDKFYMTAEVTHCYVYNRGNKIISPKRPPYRVHATFLFLRKGERILLRSLISSIHKANDEAKSTSQKQSGSKEVDVEEEDIDGFEDLI